jgi:hypothetical protein
MFKFDACFPTPCCFATRGQSKNTIGVTRRTNVNQPHHKGLVLVYSMENQMPFLPHTKKQ